ncbi:MAG: hypothetical protein IJL80_01090 [Treponema sp.]|nr:hypothetical protein [Treponema sp.]
MFVKYAPKHPHVKVVPVVNSDGLSVAAESVMLSPGTNEVSDEKWGKIKDSLAAEIANGTIKPFSVKAKKSGQDTKAKTLKDVPPQVAAGIIAGCSSKDTLRAWFKDRLSDDVAILVVRRMRELNMDLDAIAESGEQLSDEDIIDEGNTVASQSEKDSQETVAESASPAAKSAGDGKNSSDKPPKTGAKGSGTKPPDGAGSDEDIPDFDNPDVKVK